MRMLVLAGLGAASLGCTGLLGGGDGGDDEAGGPFGSGDTEAGEDGNTDNDGGADPDGDGLSNDEEDELGTDGDEVDSDGDGWSDGEEVADNSDPLDEGDKPYQGGWSKGDCRDDIQATGYDEGDISRDFVLPDQFGDNVSLHDFCDRSVLVIFSAFW